MWSLRTVSCQGCLFISTRDHRTKFSIPGRHARLGLCLTSDCRSFMDDFSTGSIKNLPNEVLARISSTVTNRRQNCMGIAFARSFVERLPSLANTCSKHTYQYCSTYAQVAGRLYALDSRVDCKIGDPVDISFH